MITTDTAYVDKAEPQQIGLVIALSFIKPWVLLVM